MEMIASFVGEIWQIGYALISVGAGFLGAWWGFSGLWSWYETANGRGDASPLNIASDMFWAAIALSITYYFAAFGGQSFSDSSSGVYPQFSSSMGAAGTANATLNALFSLMAMMGFMAKTKALILAREVGRGKSEHGPLRVIGYLFCGAILGDMGTAITKLDQSLKSGIFN